MHTRTPQTHTNMCLSPITRPTLLPTTHTDMSFSPITRRTPLPKIRNTMPHDVPNGFPCWRTHRLQNLNAPNTDRRQSSTAGRIPSTDVARLRQQPPDHTKKKASLQAEQSDVVSLTTQVNLLWASARRFHPTPLLDHPHPPQHRRPPHLR